MLSDIVKFCQKRVAQYGQQYFYFGIFGLFNYPLAYLFRAYYENLPERENLLLRATATLFCIPLIFYKQCPNKLKKYLPAYWYFAITYSISFFCTYLLLQNNFSQEWIINMGIGLFIQILLIDWLMFLICLTVGAFCASLVFIVLHDLNEFHMNISGEIEYLGIYMYVCIFVLGVLFSRNKQEYQTGLLKQKNKLNVELFNSLETKSKKLVEALDSNKYFIQNISHELRTPVHGILGLTEQLNDNYKKLSHSRISSILHLIYSSAYNLSEMINNLIDFSSYRQGRIHFNFKLTNFKKLIEQSIEANNVFLASTNKNLSIVFNYSSKAPISIVVDPIRIQQVINNLLSNAIKYSNDSGSTIRIGVKNMDKKLIQFTIEDEGIGIPQGEENVIFNAFIRSSTTKNTGSGKGLGLAIVKEIITGHKGKIWAKNNDKKGTRFVFVIPKNQL